MTSARAIALQLLCQWSPTGRLADELLADHAGLAALAPADRALAMELFYGCLRHQLTLDFVVDQFVRRPPRSVVRELLRLGLYQLIYLRTPAHAAVHATVTLANDHATAAEAGFVNAVLRQVARHFASIEAQLRAAPDWVRLSHPQWLWQRWTRQWSVEAVRLLGEWNNQPPPVYVRAARALSAVPAAVTPSGLHPLCYRVTNAAEFFAGSAWQEGAFYVQDPSTLLAVDLLDPQPGETVLDLCAAPGGKTTYLAQKMQHRGRIVATDVSATRLGLVGENCRRLGIGIVATLACDGTRANGCLRGTRFDRVLVDAPCSNTGVIRRRPDLRWRLHPMEIERLAATQAKLLATAATVTRPGGVIVYSTCSLEPVENEAVVDQFLAEQPAFTEEERRQTFPPRDGMDGAFAVRLRRR